jgi:hypothetical protein
MELEYAWDWEPDLACATGAYLLSDLDGESD